MAESAAEQTAMAEPPVLVFKDGFPGVPRFSGLLDYLQLCQVGVSIRSDTLECILHKQSEDHWSGYDNEHPPITCRELVQEVRAVLREDEPGCDVDKVFVTMEPIDKVAIKREVVAAGEEDEDEEKEEAGGTGTAKMVVCELDGEDGTEKWTEDGKVVAALAGDIEASRSSQFQSYQLPLHLRLPRLKKKIEEEEEEEQAELAAVAASSPAPSLPPSEEDPPAKAAASPGDVDDHLFKSDEDASAAPASAAPSAAAAATDYDNAEADSAVPASTQGMTIHDPYNTIFIHFVIDTWYWQPCPAVRPGERVKILSNVI